MKRIVNAQVWEVTAAEFAASSRVFKKGDLIYVTKDTSSVKVGDGISTLASMMAIDTAVKNHAASAINATATVTAAQLKTGLITSTSVAAVALTLPTAALLLAILGKKVSRGTWFDFAVDNSAGASVVTVTASASITAIAAVLVGDAGATLTVAAGAVGIFRIYFVTATAAKIARVV